MRISSWNYVRVPKAWLWAHVQSFSLKFSPWTWFLALCIFARLFWRARETLVKQPPDLQMNCDDLTSWQDTGTEAPAMAARQHVPLYKAKFSYPGDSCRSPVRCYAGPRSTNVFSIAIQIQWKLHFALISIPIQWSLQNFVHGTTAVLSWHVQKFVVMWWPVTELQQGEVSIKFELLAKNR